MSDDNKVIELVSKKSMKQQSTSAIATTVLKAALKDVDKIQELMIIIKTPDNDISMYHTGLDLRDKSYIIQVLTSDVQQELCFPEDVEFEPDQ